MLYFEKKRQMKLQERISGKRFKSDPNLIYLDIGIEGKDDQAVDAKVDFTRAVPIINSPDDYKVAITQFSLTTSNIPVMTWPVDTNNYKVGCFIMNPWDKDQKEVYNNFPAWTSVYPTPVLPLPNLTQQVPQEIFYSSQNDGQPVDIPQHKRDFFSYEDLIGQINIAIAAHWVKNLDVLYNLAGLPSTVLDVLKENLVPPWLTLENGKPIWNYSKWFTSDYFHQLQQQWGLFNFGGLTIYNSGFLINLCISLKLARMMNFPYYYLGDYLKQKYRQKGGPIDPICGNVIDNMDVINGVSPLPTTPTSELFYWPLLDTEGFEEKLVILNFDLLQKSSRWVTSESPPFPYESFYTVPMIDVNNKPVPFQPPVVTAIGASFLDYKTDVFKSGPSISDMSAFNSPTRIFFRTDLPIYADLIGGQKPRVDSIMQTFEISSLIGSPFKDISLTPSTLLYYSIMSGTPLSKIFIQAFYLNNGQAVPIVLSSGESMTIKFIFEKI